MPAGPEFKKNTYRFFKERLSALFVLAIGFMMCIAIIVVCDRTVPEDNRIKAVLPKFSTSENLLAVIDQDISAKEIIIHDFDSDYSVYVSSGTIADALEKTGISLGEYDELSYSVDQEIHDGIELTITRVSVEEYSVIYPEPYKTVMQSSDALPAGVEKLIQEGQDGERKYNYKTFYRNGVESETILTSTEVIEKPTNEIFACGTENYYRPEINFVVDEENHTITTEEGIVFDYSNVISVSATAYTTEGKSFKLTYSGATAAYGIIAVDPKIIPLGTKMFVVDPDGEWVYGYCIAGDIGGMIKGKRVDLFFDTKRECINFGRQPATVYILE